MEPTKAAPSHSRRAVILSAAVLWVLIFSLCSTFFLTQQSLAVTKGATAAPRKAFRQARWTRPAEPTVYTDAGCAADAFAPYNVSSATRPGGRALVVYILTSADEYRSMQQWDNFNLFARRALTKPGGATALFDGVDYVLAKERNSTDTETEVCSRSGNVRSVWLPNRTEAEGGELCGYARALAAVGAAEAAAYSHVVLMNSTVRGPFIDDGTQWVDAVALAGRPRYDPKAVATTDVVSSRWGPALQFLSLPAAALQALRPALAASCRDLGAAGNRRRRLRLQLEALHEDMELVLPLPVASGSGALPALFAGGFTLYSLATQTRFASLAEMRAAAPRAALDSAFGAVESPGLWRDPCLSVFAVFGGRAWEQRSLDRGVVRSVRLLSMWHGNTPPHAAAMSVDLFRGPACNWTHAF